MSRREFFLIGSILTLGLMLVAQRMLIARAIGGFGSELPQLSPPPRMIMILDTGMDAHRLWIDRFTEVTWINDSHSTVKIEFGKGPNCSEISAAAFPALGIRVQPERCFIIRSIPSKGTLRFRFEEPGDYHYEVGYVGTNRGDHGKLKIF